MAMKVVFHYLQRYDLQFSPGRCGPIVNLNPFITFPYLCSQFEAVILLRIYLPIVKRDEFNETYNY